MTMITPSYLGETIEYSSLHACRSTLEDPTVHIDLPPLRNRREDNPLLTAAFLREMNKRHDRNVRIVSDDALAALREYRWPGNVRELRNVLEGIIVLSQTDTIEFNDLPDNIQGNEGTSDERIGSDTTLAELECVAITERLKQTGGNRQLTADSLGISTRTLLRKIQGYRLNPRPGEKSSSAASQPNGREGPPARRPAIARAINSPADR